MRRAEIQRTAHGIRVRAQREGWPVRRVADAIHDELPEVLALEAMRLAYGWTRAQALDQIAALYDGDGLRPPAINTAMLCRWEHGLLRPSAEYAEVLCRLYRARPEQLGFAAAQRIEMARCDCGAGLPGVARDGWYGPPHQQVAGMDEATHYQMMANGNGELLAIRESLQLTLEAEGPAGGPAAHEQLDGAVEYYALNYSKYPPPALFGEVQRCRGLVAGMLRPAQPSGPRRHLGQIAGWLSALLGNLAFHLADHSGARAHLSTAARLGVHVGDDGLVAWTRGAQSMVARYQSHYAEALELARDGSRYATNPLARSQLLAWAELPALAGLGRRSEAAQTLLRASREIEADPDGAAPGRFGFDMAEFELHATEAHLLLGQTDQARTHAQAALDHARLGTPGWAAATLNLARAEAQQARPDQAVHLALLVLDGIPPERLRHTSRQRLVALDAALTPIDQPETRTLHERLLELPPPALPSA